MKYLFIIFLFSFSISISHHSYLEEVDSLKNVMYKLTPKARPYHLVNAEVYRRFRFYNRDSAKYYLDEGIKLAEKYKLDTAMRDYHNLLGLYYFDLGEFDKALSYFYLCMEYSYKLVDYGAVGYSYNDVGYVFYVQGLWDLALQHYKEGVLTIKGRKDTLAEVPLYYLYQGIGLCYTNMKQLDSARKYLDITVKIAKKEKHEINYNRALLYLAGIYSLDKSQSSKSDSLYRIVLNYFLKDEKWPDGLPYTYFYIGSNYASMHKLDSSIKYYKLSVEALKKLGWEKKIIDINYKLLSVYLQKKEFKNVDSLLAYNDSLITQFFSTDLNADQFYYKYLTFEAKNNIDSAYFYFKKYNTIKDSILHLSITGQVASVSRDMQILKNEREKEVTRNKTTQNIAILIFIIVLGILIFVILYMKFRIQKRNLEIINHKNEDLNTANMLLDEANNTKDRFFSIISHDLKNPIGAIKGTTEMLDKDYDMFDDTDKKEIINQVYTASNSVLGLLESLLIWSRTQSGKIVYSPELFNLSLLFNSVVNLLRPSAISKNIDIDIDVKECMNVMGDVNMMNTILRNLISNSIKFTPKNGKVFIRARNEGSKSIIEIEDNGVGISKENIGKLFNFSSNITTLGTDNEKGTGLGLILVKEFIDKHNGVINIESEVGVGTKFILEIPNG